MLFFKAMRGRKIQPYLKLAIADRHSGFSLVEVVIALGLISIVILPMVGLLSIGFTTNRESTEDANLTLCAETTLSILHADGFSSVSTNTGYQSNDTTPDFYFDATGRLIVDANGLPATTPDSSTYYACSVTRQTPTLDQATTRLLYLQLKFSWPWLASAANRQNRVVIGSLAKYD